MRLIRLHNHRRRALMSLAVIVGLCGHAVPSFAEGWTWPWEKPAQAPRTTLPPPPQIAPPAPRDPNFRAPYPDRTSPSGPQANYPPPGGRPPICLQLEQRLAQEANRGLQTRDALPRIDGEMRAVDKQVQGAQSQLDRNDCFDYFLFTKTLRRTKVCVDLNTQVEVAKRRLSDLEIQKQNLVATGSSSYQDDIIRELARNACGANYAQEANRRSGGGLWQDETVTGPGGSGGRFDQLPYATYRTMCVRLCDGFYFPVSFSTLPNHFDQDADVCKSECAAPAELYYYQNPGGAVEQMTSFASKQNYTGLKTAFRFRKEYVQGCSCKKAEYVPPSGATPDRRADAGNGVGGQVSIGQPSIAAATLAPPQPAAPRR